MDHKTIESKWRKIWQEKSVYRVKLQSRAKSREKKFYNLMMFPYPSAEGLHVGNMYAFTGADVYGRFQAMQGYEVFEPIGLDGFGIHSENYAIKINAHPMDQAKISEKRFYDQLARIGNRFSWDNRLETYDPQYYQWTQWLFVQMFNHGLAYRKKASVNWCPSCKTVLADEQVIEGKCERCSAVVAKRETEQWFFKITKYADRLLNNLKKINWPKKITIAQEQWIGKSRGLSIDFRVEGIDKPITVWTKFWETVFGTTYLVLAPEHWSVGEIRKLQEPNLRKYSDEYVKKAKNKSDQERLAGAGDKTGVFTGVMATNPVNGEPVPVWIADYVLKDVGTGAVMGVPAHDERDFAFVKKYKLPIIRVVAPKVDFYRSYLMGGADISDQELSSLGVKIIKRSKDGRKIEIPKKSITKYESLVERNMTVGYWNEYVGEKIVFIFKNKNGKIEKFVLGLDNERKITELASKFTDGFIKQEDFAWSWLADVDIYKDLIIHEIGGTIENSGQFDGLDAWGEGKTKMAEWMIAKKFGRWETNYHLRDWLISRQRYWGPPIPMIFCKNCGWYPEENLPVKLPYLKNFKPTDDGKPPLERAEKSWLYTQCPKCGGKAKRETEVSDTFLDSSWYFLRYPSVNSNKVSPRSKPTRRNLVGQPFDPEITKRWLPVDAYIGGAEHAVLHLLYSRFVWMALQDWGFIPKKLGDEPFPFLYGHGLIIKDGAKMSKSKGNIVNPDEYIDKYGVDSLRMYLMFIGPYDQGGDFRDTGMRGMSRFLARVEKLLSVKDSPRRGTSRRVLEGSEVSRLRHQTVKRVTLAMKNLRYNVALAAIMEFVNGLEKFTSEVKEVPTSEVFNSLKALILMLAPFAPYTSEELWQKIGGKFSIHQQQWPKFSEKLAREERVTIVVQINGKLRKKAEVSLTDSQNKTKMIALAKKLTEQKNPVKVIFVPGRLINLVVK